ncbi:hypothetical protein BY996DRAFT_6411513 [Phakopsora pachyrhizi]|nr:hypothetical protein BY996DRAFT_6411513 [Phakopsora pachyrhizi]
MTALSSNKNLLNTEFIKIHHPLDEKRLKEYDPEIIDLGSLRNKKLDRSLSFNSIDCGDIRQEIIDGLTNQTLKVPGHSESDLEFAFKKSIPTDNNSSTSSHSHVLHLTLDNLDVLTLFCL